MATVIRHATIVTGDAGRTLHHDGAIAVDGDRIAAVGSSDDVERRFPHAEIVEGRGKAVFPGFVNCHTHLWFTVARGIQEDFGFPSTLRFPITVTAMLSAEENRVFALLGAIEAIRSGTTALLEVGYRVPDYAEAVAASGLRVVFGQSTSDLEPDGVPEGRFVFSPARGEKTLQSVVDVIARWHGACGGRVTCAVAAHAPEACSPANLRQARALAEQHRLRTTIHLNQSRWEVEAVMRVRGVRPTEYVFEHGFLGPSLVAAHCRFMSASEVSLLGRSGAAISHNAAMAARRAAAPPLRELAAAGAVIALGTDNMAEDMVEAVRTALFMERVRTGDAMDPQPEDVLQWATRNGARALGLDDVGTLEPGRKADLVVLDTRRAHLVPTMRIVSAFVHNGQPADIESVMVDGTWIMRDHRLLTIDEPDILRRADKIGRRVWHDLAARYPDVPFPIRLPPPQTT